MAIITRWRMPPESSCGYCPMRRAGSRDAHGVAAPRRRGARRLARGQADVRLDRLGQLRGRSSQHRVERGHRLLEDHRDRGRRGRRRIARSASASEIGVAEPDVARRRCARAGCGSRPHDRERGHRLAGAGSRRRCTASRPAPRRRRGRRRRALAGLQALSASTDEIVDGQDGSLRGCPETVRHQFEDERGK